MGERGCSPPRGNRNFDIPIPMQQKKSELKELHKNFVKHHPRPRTCAQPIHHVPLAACSKARLKCRLTGVAHQWRSVLCFWLVCHLGSN